jgi:hypothetical protein
LRGVNPYVDIFFGRGSAFKSVKFVAAGQGKKTASRGAFFKLCGPNYAQGQVAETLDVQYADEVEDIGDAA